MTGYQSKKAAALDEDGMYLVHHTAQPAQEPVAIVHIKDGCLVGSHRDESKPFPDGQYGLWPITTPPQPVGQAPCVRHCESTAYEIVIRGLKGDIERMKAAQRTWVGSGDLEDSNAYLTQPEQERNFCPRCGKRTADLTVIHTCTPPQKNT